MTDDYYSCRKYINRHKADLVDFNTHYSAAELIDIPLVMYTATLSDAQDILKELCDCRRHVRQTVERWVTKHCTLCKLFVKDTSITEHGAGMRGENEAECYSLVVHAAFTLRSILNNTQPNALVKVTEEAWEALRGICVDVCKSIRVALFHELRIQRIEYDVPRDFKSLNIIEVPAGMAHWLGLIHNGLPDRLIVPKPESEIQMDVIQSTVVFRRTRDTLWRRFRRTQQSDWPGTDEPCYGEAIFRAKLCSDIFSFADGRRHGGRAQRLSKLRDMLLRVSSLDGVRDLVGNLEFIVPVVYEEEKRKKKRKERKEEEEEEEELEKEEEEEEEKKKKRKGKRKTEEMYIRCLVFHGLPLNDYTKIKETITQNDVIYCLAFYFKKSLSKYAVVTEVVPVDDLPPPCSEFPEEEEKGEEIHQRITARRGTRMWVNIEDYIKENE